MGAIAGTVLVIDDEEGIRDYLSEVLSLEGYECKCFQESLAALSYLSRAKVPPDLVMADIRMPGVNGLELLKRVHALSPELPVILISGVYESSTAVEAVQAGAADYLFKPARPAEVLSMVARHVGVGPSPMQADVQSVLAGFLAGYEPRGQGSAGDWSPEPALELFQAFVLKRYETVQHSMRVAAYATLLADTYGLAPRELSALRFGALLHDIGKIAIPRNVLLKPGALSEKEWEVMRTHPRVGYLLLTAFQGMEETAEIVYAHHEHYDGTGYPRGLRGEEIPLGARLFSIVDAVDAITCNRPYRPARGFDAAYQELQKGRGSQFDPKLVDLFLSLPQARLLGIRNRFLTVE